MKITPDEYRALSQAAALRGDFDRAHELDQAAQLAETHEREDAFLAKHQQWHDDDVRDLY